MIQLRLVQHHTTQGGFSTYQADVDNAYSLVRIGKVAALAHAKCGPVAALVVEQVAANGYVPASQIAGLVNDTLPSDEKVSSLRINRSLRSLACHGFLKKVRPAHLQILHDARQDVDIQFQQHPGADSKSKGKKAQEQHAVLVKTELEQRFDSFLSPESFDISEEPENGMNVLDWSLTQTNVGHDHRP